MKKVYRKKIIMEKYLEDYLWNEISYLNDEKWTSQFHRSPRDVISELLEKKWINSPKQAWRTLEKWSAKGIYNYGSCLDLGWKEKPSLKINLEAKPTSSEESQFAS